MRESFTVVFLEQELDAYLKAFTVEGEYHGELKYMRISKSLLEESEKELMDQKNLVDKIGTE